MSNNINEIDVLMACIAYLVVRLGIVLLHSQHSKKHQYRHEDDYKVNYRSRR